MTAKKSLLLLSLMLACGFIGGLVVSGRMSLTAPTSATQPAPTDDQNRPSPMPSVGAPGGALPDLTQVAERAIQASVNISSTELVPVDPFLQMFYGADSVQPQTSLGSGVVVSADGYVLTNSHVVGTARDPQIRVTLADNREFEAKVVGNDPLTDLAVVKVEATGLRPLPWGDSERLRVAEWVLAVGNPFAFNQTVTLGIVSARNRHDPQLATYNDFIQTDAAINPGNSGGALVNNRGELVGINTMIYSRTGGYQGIGFAVPANLARNIMEQLIKTGEIVRGSIGNLTLRTITAEEAKARRFGTVGGVLVYNMRRNDPAYRAGIVPGDIITAFNGNRVNEQSQLERLIAETPIGSIARVEVQRRGETRTFQVPVAQMTLAGRRF